MGEGEEEKEAKEVEGGGGRGRREGGGVGAGIPGGDADTSSGNQDVGSNVYRGGEGQGDPSNRQRCPLAQRKGGRKRAESSCVEHLLSKALEGQGSQRGEHRERA